MDQFQQMFARMGGAGGAAGGGADVPVVDSAETIQISSLSLLKMLKHARAGVPFEVMGLMLGEFVDPYTVRVADVFSMPQKGTTVSVESVDEVFQQEMIEMLKQTGRMEAVVGWYHSHPGFGCWLSSTDVNTAQSFEQLDPRCVAVVVDPIQSVKGRVEIDAFRTINPQLLMMGQEPRQHTANLSFLKKPDIAKIIKGLNRNYYAISIAYRKNEFEEKMLMNLHRRLWTKSLALKPFAEADKSNAATMEELAELADRYHKRVVEEEDKELVDVMVANVGKVDAKRRLQSGAEELMADNIVQCLGTMLYTIVF
mmetsp:Transcript_27438/g.94932  ORF Transcript_27438/g.94932 Transcript_27438/m.94932 type:complete len:312 (-) Transcript_27438:163-1098(-)